MITVCIIDIIQQVLTYIIMVHSSRCFTYASTTHRIKVFLFSLGPMNDYLFLGHTPIRPGTGNSAISDGQFCVHSWIYYLTLLNDLALYIHKCDRVILWKALWLSRSLNIPLIKLKLCILNSTKDYSSEHTIISWNLTTLVQISSISSHLGLLTNINQYNSFITLLKKYHTSSSTPDGGPS